MFNVNVLISEEREKIFFFSKLLLIIIKNYLSDGNISIIFIFLFKKKKKYCEEDWDQDLLDEQKYDF